MTPELAVFGNLIVDDIVYPDGSTRIGQPGGAALFTALGARLWQVEVGIGSVVGDDYPAAVIEKLNRLGIDLAGLRTEPGPGMRTWLLYEGRRRQVVHRLDSPSHESMSPVPRDLPASWRPAAIHLAPMPLPVQEAWVEALRDVDCLLSVDPYELVDERSLERCRRVFRRTDLVAFSEDELLLDKALARPEEGLRRIAGSGAAGRLRYLILKRGVRGGLALDTHSGSLTPWQPGEPVVAEETGAGDAFAGGLLAGLIRGRSLTESLQQGAVSASFALEGLGASSLLETDPAEPRRRLGEWFGEGRVA